MWHLHLLGNYYQYLLIINWCFVVSFGGIFRSNQSFWWNIFSAWKPAFWGFFFFLVFQTFVSVFWGDFVTPATFPILPLTFESIQKLDTHVVLSLAFVNAEA